MLFIKLFFLAATLLSIVYAESTHTEIERFLTTAGLVDSLPFIIPRKISSCIINRSGVTINESLIKETLHAIQSVRIPKFQEENVELQGIAFSLDYSVSSEVDCEKNSQIVLTIETDITGEDPDRTIVSNDRVQGTLRVPSQTSPGEIAGRAAGWISSVTTIWLAPDIKRQIFFSLMEDDGVEVSIVGFHRLRDTHDPLEGLDINVIAESLRDWLGMGENKTIVKVTTRDIADHPAVLSALFRAQQPHAKESYDPVTGRFTLIFTETREIDAQEFVELVADASVSLFRAGSAARLVRLRRREAQVYVFVGQDDDETFQNKARLFANGMDIAIMAPPSSQKSFNVTKQLLMGLADCVGGISSSIASDHRWYIHDGSNAGHVPEWIFKRARENIILNELHRSIKAVREALMLFLADKPDIEAIISEFAAIQKMLLVEEWDEARDILRGPLRSQIRALTRASRSERNKCCEQRIVNTAAEYYSEDSRAGRRTMFLVVYSAVAFIVLFSVASAIWVSRQPVHGAVGRDSTTIFGRQHLD